MIKTNLHIQTITPIGNFIEINKHPFVVYEKNIFFVNLQKLSNILSLMKIFFDFNEFYNSNSNKDITPWLKGCGLLTEELLTEISVNKIRYQKREKISGVYRFFENDNYYDDNEILKKYLCDFLKKTFKNILLYEYFANNNAEFNEYISDLTLFFKHNPDGIKSTSLDLLLRSIYEIDRIKLKGMTSQLDETIILIKTNVQSREEIFSLEKVYEKSNLTLRECVNSGLSARIEIISAESNYFCRYLEKYLALAQEIANKRICLNSNADVDLLKKNHPNFCFLTSNQMFYMNLSQLNKHNLNQNLKEFYGDIFEKQIFYHDLNNVNPLKLFNYAHLELIN